jgi:hypothetical protein
MLAGGLHVKIGTHEYALDESQAGHYRKRFRPLMSPKFDTGDPGSETLDQEKLVWEMTDWSGGEGNNVYYEDQPSVYRIANGMNVRKRGQATVRPKRTRATLASTDESKRSLFAVGDGALWALQNTQAHFSTDYGDTWTTLTEANTGINADFDAAGYITAAAGDEAFVYYAAFEASGTKRRTIIAHTAAAVAGSVVVTAADSDFPYANLELFNGRLYAWTGRKLYEIDVFETWPLAVTGDKYRKVYDTGTDPATSHVQGNEWTSGMVDCGSSLAFFYSRRLSGGTIYEYKDGAAAPIWHGPIGFTIGSIVFQSGILYIFGHWGMGLVTLGTENTAEGSGQIYGLVMDTLKEIDFGKIREFDTDASGGMLCTVSCPSYGSQVMFAGNGTGRIFVYDLSADGVSMLDHLKDAPAGGDGLDFDNNPAERIGDMITVGPHRLVSVFRPNSSAAGADEFQVLTYEADDPANRETDGSITDSTYLNYLESAEWHFRYPLSPKALHGLYVAFLVEDTGTTSGLLANQRITVEYSLDGATYVAATAITSTTAPIGVRGLVYLPTPGARFHRLRIRFKVDNNSTDGVKPPIVYGVLPDASLQDWIEEWDLLVRIKDEPASNARGRQRRTSGGILYDYLEDLYQARAEVTFRDGYRYNKQRPGTGDSAKGTHGYVEKTCRLVAFEADLEKLGEGTARVVLRAVPAAT